MSGFLRLVDASIGLASYLRPFSRDMTALGDCLASGFDIGRGVILNAAQLERGRELRDLARERRHELVLDPQSVELSMPWGVPSLPKIPWSFEGPHQPETMAAVERTEAYAEKLARVAIENGMTAVLAPSHYLSSFPHPWFEVDLGLARMLRERLDHNAGSHIAIYYPLISNLAQLAQEPVQNRILGQLSNLVDDQTVDAVWLRPSNFGSNKSGPISIRRYLRLARKAHALGIPLVAERSGTLGIALVAYGAVGGIESGVTFGESYSIASSKRSNGAPFVPSPRVYISQLGAFLRREVAREFLTRRGYRSAFGCQRACCRKGVDDMIANPRRHFVVSRSREIAELSSIPPSYRAQHYMDTWLRPASDYAVRAAKAEPALEALRLRLDTWRITFSAILEEDKINSPSISLVPAGRLRRGN